MSEESKSASRIEDKDYYSSMSHFYRGEMGRIMVWRQRLDTTTNWAILTSTGVITFGLSHPEVTHLIFMVANIIILLLLWIEGRRYRYYDAFRARVRLLEAHFMVPVVLRRKEVIEGDWRELLAEDLLLPSFKIGVREGMARRLKRNYIWIFLILQFAWVLKVYLHGGVNRGQIAAWGEFIVSAQQNQPLPHFLFWSIGAGFWVVIIWLAFYSQKERYASGEIQRRDPSRGRWKI